MILFLTGGGGAAMVFVLIHTASLQTLNGIIFLIFGGVFLLGAVWVLFYMLRSGLGLIRAGSAGREQQGEALTTKGTIVGSLEDADRNGVNGVLIKLHLHDGTNKI